MGPTEMNTPNNAAALTYMGRQLTAQEAVTMFANQDATIRSLRDELAALRATLAQPDALTSQPSGEAVGRDALRLADELDEYAESYGSTHLLVEDAKAAAATLRALYTHPSADAPGVAVEPVRLEWSSTLRNGERVNYAKAEQACAALGEGWRMPTRMELESILDLTRHEPAIDTDRFPDTKSGAYWSSTPCAWSSDCAWIVSFHYGYVYDYHRDGSLAFVRAVRSVPAGQSPAKENGSE